MYFPPSAIPSFVELLSRCCNVLGKLVDYICIHHLIRSMQLDPQKLARLPIPLHSAHESKLGVAGGGRWVSMGHEGQSTVKGVTWAIATRAGKTTPPIPMSPKYPSLKNFHHGVTGLQVRPGAKSIDGIRSVAGILVPLSVCTLIVHAFWSNRTFERCMVPL